MADEADKTTATEGLSPIPFDHPCTIAEKNANGGWDYKDLPEGPAGKGKGPGKGISGNR